MNPSDSQSDIRRENAESLRALPSVHRVVEELGAVDLPRPIVVDVVRRRLETLREAISDRGASAPASGEIVESVREELRGMGRGRLGSVINATGIVIHTNLGRSPLGEAAVDAVVRAARDYVNLEYDLEAGRRGGRGSYVERALALLCGAQAACVVNNCAAALILILRHFAARPPRTGVVISRGELVQIGGGFRVPEILEAGGANLREIGTTNKTTIEDYASAIDGHTALILRVHRSNFFMGGFVESPGTGELARLAVEKGIPLVEDIGSGAMFDTTELGGNEREPTPQATIQAGADLVTFSGDKLLGGPQAGIIAGSAKYVAALKREPFFRALRCDKLVLAALEATADALLDGKADEIPVRRMMGVSHESLHGRAERIAAALLPRCAVRIGCGSAQVGGGSLPRTLLPSVTIEIPFQNPEELAARLRHASTPVIGYVADGVFKLDLRTVFPRQDELLVSAIRTALAP